MPGSDGTGPKRQGAMAGGGRGYCAMPVNNREKQPAQGTLNARGRGRGMRNCFKATGMPGWMRAQKGMRAFGSWGRAISAEERSTQS